MLLWHMDGYANAGKGESGGAALSAPISRLPRARGSTKRTRRQFGVGERNQNWFLAVRGTRMPPATRLRPRFARKKLIELVCGRRRWMLVAAS